ncbi:MAG: extracellular solute-binding protein [Spirochaetaceae bacterium]|jgi:putative aldouronate transport system substrate-binding protein|nr:extracellular solute-binding protein [Spirochaetaceae bacterium]
MKKVLVVVLAAVALLAVVGCAKKEGASGGTVKIKVEVFDRGTDGGKTNPTNNKWTEWIKEKLLKDENIEVEFVAVPRGDEQTALINLMAAGSPPDVAVTYALSNVTQWGDQGGLFDLAPYIDTTLKDLNEFLGPDEALPGRRMIERTRDNASGKIFSIQARRMNVARLNTFIRKDWLDKLGLPLPKTTEEYYNALAAFKANEKTLLQGVQTNAALIPFSLIGARVDWEAGNMLDSFIDPTLSDRDRWVNTAIERSFVVPGYKEGLRFLNKMFNAGLVDPQFALYKDDQIQYNNIKSGIVGSFIQNWDQIYRDSDKILLDLQKNVPGAEMVPVDCFTSTDGLTHKSSYDAAGVYFFIPAGSKNPDAALRYLNWLSKYENYHFIQTGPEGTVHTIVDGVLKLNPNAGDGWIQNSAQNIDYTVMMNGLFLGSQEENIKALAAGYTWPADVIVNAYTLAMANARPALVVSPKSPLVAEGPVGETLASKSTEVYAQSIQAKPADFDRVYDAQVKEWLDKGAQAIIDERAEKYQAP